MVLNVLIILKTTLKLFYFQEYGHIVMESKFAELKLVTIGFDLLFGLAVKVSRPRWMTLVTLGSQQMEMSPCL